MLENMNAAEVIREIDALSEQEQHKVMAHVRHLEEERYHAEQVNIALQRLEDLKNGREKTVSHEEAMRRVHHG